MKDEDYIHDSNPLIGKLLKLKYRINETYRASGNYDEDCRTDKSYVMKLIKDVRHNSKTFIKLSKEDGTKCNAMWRQYEGN
jgi:hypothetical protein